MKGKLSNKTLFKKLSIIGSKNTHLLKKSVSPFINFSVPLRYTTVFPEMLPKPSSCIYGIYHNILQKETYKYYLYLEHILIEKTYIP